MSSPDLADLVSIWGAPGECGLRTEFEHKFKLCSDSVQTLFKVCSNNVKIQTLFILCSNSVVKVHTLFNFCSNFFKLVHWLFKTNKLKWAPFKLSSNLFFKFKLCSNSVQESNFVQTMEKAYEFISSLHCSKLSQRKGHPVGDIYSQSYIVLYMEGNRSLGTRISVTQPRASSQNFITWNYTGWPIMSWTWVGMTDLVNSPSWCAILPW